MSEQEEVFRLAKPENPDGKRSENALRIIKKRYLAQGEDSWHDVVDRVARHVTQDDPAHYVASYTMLFEGLFIPNSPTLRNAGKPNGQLSACFVIGPEGMARALRARGVKDEQGRDPDPDSIFVMNHLKAAASEITKSGGGVGVHYGAIRPKGSFVKYGAHKNAIGPVSFMASLNDWTRRLTQAGFREAAMMSILPVSHPDVIEFLRAKRKEGAIHNTNISIAVTDDFMVAVREDGWFELSFPGWEPTLDHFKVEVVEGRTKKKVMPEGFTERDFQFAPAWAPASPGAPTTNEQGELLYGGGVVKTQRCFVKARTLFHAIVENAHANGEPGLFFVDRENTTNPWHLVDVPIRGTNPCGEQPLPDFGTCNLGHIALGRVWKLDVENNERKVIDYALLSRLVHLGVRFLDNVISTNSYPLKEITETANKYRNIGLGVVGWADLLLELGIPYGSEESLELAEKVGHFIETEAHEASRKLYYEKGGDDEVFAAVGRRNLVLFTVAPTGTTGQIVDMWGGGIEPIYAPTTWRYDHVHPEGFEMKHPKADEPYFRSAINDDPKKQITPEQHVLMQAAWQKSVDSAISKTINLPNKATVQDVKDVYLLAFDTGCKGITVYRDGSRKVEVLATKEKQVAFDPTLAAIEEAGARPEVKEPTRGKNKGKRIAPERPKTLPAIVRKARVADKEDRAVKVYVGVGMWESKPYETFVNPAVPYSNAAVLEALLKHADLNGIPKEFVDEQLEKAKGKLGSEKLTRLISMHLRHGFKSCMIASVVREKATSMYDLAAVIASVLEEAAPCDCEGVTGATCPDCNAALVYEGGCYRCTRCDYSKCG